MSQGPTQIVTIELTGARTHTRHARGDRSIRRTLTIQQRSDMVRERVRDAVTLIGLGDEEYGLKQFARRAEVAAGRSGLRFFKGDTTDPVDIAASSLRNLLRLRSASTGRSEHWVLDLWEAVLEEIYHGVPKPHRTPDPGKVDAADGVKVFADPKSPTRSLAMRLLDAYTSRDDEAVMQLALELEEKETS